MSEIEEQEGSTWNVAPHCSMVEGNFMVTGEFHESPDPGMGERKDILWETWLVM